MSVTRNHRAVVPVAALLIAGLVLSSCSSTDDDISDQSTSQGSGRVGDQQDELWTATDPAALPASARDRSDTFVSTINKPGGVFLPGFYDNGWDGNASAPIFAGLVSQQDDGTVIPDLAESWDVSADNLTYTFHLRDGLTFSDGSPLTADDVKFSLTLFNDPEFSGEKDFSRFGIVGADAYRKGDAKDISGITVTDPRTIEISTEKASPLALVTLGGEVLSAKYYGADYHKGSLDYLRDLYGKPLGAGPYVLDQYIPGQEIRYTANSSYYGGKPDVEHLIFKFVSSDNTLAAFQNGDIDHGGFKTAPETLQALKDLKFADVKTRTIPDLGQIWLNNRNPKLADTRVRQALTYGLDRGQIVQAKFKGQGQVADIYAAPTQWSFDDSGVTTYDFDPEKAKTLLDEAGWSTGSDGIRQKDGQRLTLGYITTSDDDPIIPIAGQNYRDIGIDFVPEVLDSNTAFARLNDLNYEAASFRTDSLKDPDDAVQEFGTDDPKINVTGYQNPTVTDLIQQGRSTIDQQERQTVYSKLYKELSQDPPTILIDYRRSISAWNEHFEGVEKFSTGGGDAAQVLASLKKKEA